MPSRPPGLQRPGRWPLQPAKKLYVILDAFVGGGHKIAQTGHAVAAFCLAKPELAKEWDNGYIIVKKAKDLASWLPASDASFTEPYWDNRLTGVACYREDGFAAELPLA